MLNQLATIKSLVYRKHFSINHDHIAMIHRKFNNMFNQRFDHNDGQIVKPVKNKKEVYQGGAFTPKLPMEQQLVCDFDRLELEESREYRQQA